MSKCLECKECRERLRGLKERWEVLVPEGNNTLLFCSANCVDSYAKTIGMEAFSETFSSRKPRQKIERHKIRLRINRVKKIA